MAEATFLNREEIPVYPVYRDPVSEPVEILLFLDSCTKGDEDSICFGECYFC